MRYRSSLYCLLGLFVLCAVCATAEQLTDEQLVDKMVEAAGGADTVNDLGVLELMIVEEETRNDGTMSSTSLSAHVSATNLENMRLEMANDVILVRNGLGGWASIRGTVDPRPQTPRMASGTVAQRLFPVLLPFTLKLEGVSLSVPVQTTFEGTPAWQLRVAFVRNFFATPIMSTFWDLYVSRKDFSLLAAEYQPDAEFADVAKEGVRYRVLSTQKVGGATFPSRLMLEGIDANGEPTAHTRITEVAIRKPERVDPGIFMHPDKLRAIEEGEIQVP